MAFISNTNSNTPQPNHTTTSVSDILADTTTNRAQNRYIDTTAVLPNPPPLSRRSHSDRAALPPVPNRSSLTTRFDHDHSPLPQFHMSPEERRRSMVALDRKRRLTSTSHETGRRRNMSGGFTNRGGQQPQQNSSRDLNGRSQSEVIDLTGSSPEHRPQMPARSVFSSSDRSRYVVPRWQPNEEVVECPICHRPFSFLFRRHHCRKCGRVVCDACSPHRITIPRQCIVHPPGTDLESSSASADFVRDDSRPFYQGWAVGEKVRLCNPCVPDPQPEQQLPQHRPQNSFILGPQLQGQHTPSAYPSFLSHAALQPNHIPPVAYDSLPVERSADSQSYRRYSPGPFINRFPYVADSEDDYSDSSSEQAPRRPSRPALPAPSFDLARAGHSRFHSLNGPVYGLPPGRQLPSSPAFSSSHGRHLTGHSSQFAHILNNPARSAEAQIAAASAAQLQSARPPRRRLREDDICPVCRRALPDRGPGGDTSEREQHVMDCIALHTGGPSSIPPATRPEAVVRSEETNQNRVAAFQPPAATTSSMSTSLPAPPPPRPAHLPPGPAPIFAASSSSSVPRQRHHQPGMVRFIATEKDCIADSDDNPPECSICMVEYEPGDRLVRLECWCKFHQECIVQWVVGRGGSCPVHKIGN